MSLVSAPGRPAKAARAALHAKKSQQGQGGGGAAFSQGQIHSGSAQRLLCDNILAMDLDFAAARCTTIIALLADEVLAGTLALKVGNALSLVQGVPAAPR